MNGLKTWFALRFAPSILLKRFLGKSAKRVFFLRQYEATVKRIWGEEFVLEGFRDAREILRREYDKLNETLDAAKVALENNEKKEDPDKTLRETFEKMIETKSKEVEDWKRKIDDHDRGIKEVEERVSSYYEQLPNLEKKINE